ncbi:hypothetical protein LCGC14_0996750 [marine sediment metagenome]|uniref:Uncharacterized protein n=1 Tax=marine sediment metagenome TaxID=412755 RepID=A0A0F9N467_9ZZZZ
MLTRLLYAIEINLIKRMLEGDSKLISMVVDFETYKKDFVTTYMARQGFDIPAVTKVVLKNGYEEAIGVHFFSKEHMKIDSEKGSVEPVYTQDLLQTSYFMPEAE